MPKNQVNDLITDQEMAFARLVLSGTMTDREAAQAAGLHPSTAAYTKTRPRVRAYMLEHRAAVEQQLVQQETEDLRKQSVDRAQILARLWEIANFSPEITRGSLTGQVKALSMIVAIEGLIPHRRAATQDKEPVPLTAASFYRAAWNRAQDDETLDQEPVTPPTPPPEEPALTSPASTPPSPVPAPPPTEPTTHYSKPGFAHWPITS